jgi:hypothetical protein
MTKDVLAKFVRVASVASVGLGATGLICAANAFAQEPPAPAAGAPPGIVEAESHNFNAPLVCACFSNKDEEPPSSRESIEAPQT